MTKRNNAVYFTGKLFDLLYLPGVVNVLKVKIILPIAKDRSKHLWITARINIFLQVGPQDPKNFIFGSNSNGNE
jgi:hypothetical protein